MIVTIKNADSNLLQMLDALEKMKPNFYKIVKEPNNTTTKAIKEAENIAEGIRTGKIKRKYYKNAAEFLDKLDNEI
ncbi:MAG: hypothetical protein LBG21_02375 [Campylobacteraceae bacterium]|nr:hypothetical protein [Campylobacteraceae bacterium]